jgi:hypothetical protein
MIKEEGMADGTGKISSPPGIRSTDAESLDNQWIPLISLWAFDHLCLFSWPLPLPLAVVATRPAFDYGTELADPEKLI